MRSITGCGLSGSNSELFAPVEAAHVARELDHGHLEAEADAEEGDSVLPGVADRRHLALDAAVAEAAGNEHAVNPGEMRLGAVLLDLLRVDPPDVHVNVVRHAPRA